MNVLIVEDEAEVALSLEDAVLAAGSAVTGIARTMSEALELAEEADVALVDVRLGDGLTGPELALRLSEQFGMGVVFVAASPEFVAQAEIGIPVVSKPVTTRSVVERLTCGNLAREKLPHPKTACVGMTTHYSVAGRQILKGTHPPRNSVLVTEL